MKAGATDGRLRQVKGARQVLRQGTNDVECQPKADDGFVRCYDKILAPRRDLEARLRAEKKSDKEVSDGVAAALKAGTIKSAPFGTMSYRYRTIPSESSCSG